MTIQVTSADERDTQLVEARQSEAISLFTTAKSYAARNDQLVGAGVAVIAAVSSIASELDLEKVVIGAPPAALLLIVYAIHVETDVRLMSAARRKLETVVDDSLGAPALIYQRCAESRKRMISVRWLHAIGVVLTVIVIAVGSNAAADEGGLVLGVYVALTGALVVTAILALSDMRRSEREVSEYLKDLPLHAVKE